MRVPYPTDRWRLPLMLLVGAVYIAIADPAHWQVAVFLVTLAMLDFLTARPPDPKV